MLSTFITYAVAFGIVGDGVNDDRPAIQAALNAAMVDKDSGGDGVVFLPAGTYKVTQAGSAYYALRVDGVRLVGEGERTVIQLAPAQRSVRAIYATGSAELIDLALDGVRGPSDIDEQRHGVFAQNAPGLVIRNVSSRGFTGDGFCLFHGVTDAKLERVLSEGNGRNGLTFNGEVDGVSVFYSTFSGNAAQQVDSEPGGVARVRNITLRNNILDGIGSNDYALTMSGTSIANGSDWIVEDNDIAGAIFVVWANFVRFSGNRVFNHTSKPSVDIWRSSSQISVLGNNIRGNAITVMGTTGSGPSDVVIAGNVVTEASPFGVRVDGAVSVSILGNILPAPIYLRATVPARDFERATVIDNGLVGIEVRGNGAARMLRLFVARSGPVSITPNVVVSYTMLP